MTSLYFVQSDAMTCADALALAAEKLGYCHLFVSTPSEFLVSTVSSLSIDSRAIDSCFSLRAFSDKGEIRWELSENHLGVATLVSTVRPNSDESVSEVSTCGEIKHQYHCWGEVSVVRDDHSIVSSGRTSSFTIPVKASIGDSVYLQTTEYLAISEDADGNTFVVDELIKGFLVKGGSNNEQ